MPGGKEMHSFTHLLLAVNHVEDTAPYLDTHRIVGKVRAFHSWTIQPDFLTHRRSPISINTRLAMMILKKNS